MANVKISGLTALSGSLALTDIFEVTQDPSGTPASVKVTFDELRALIAGWIPLETQTLSNDTSIDFDQHIDTTFETYAFVFSEVQASSDQIEIRVSDDAGTSYDSGSSDYTYRHRNFQSGGTTEGNQNDETADSIECLDTGLGGSYINGVVYMHKPWAFHRTQFSGEFVHSGSAGTEMRGGFFFGMRNGATSVDAVRFLPATSDWDEGRITLFGINHNA